MRAIVEKKIIDYKLNREKRELTRIVPKLDFKIVVNNYRQQEMPDKIDGGTDKTMASRQIGLPSQPTRYLKYPEYDWL